MIFKNYNHRSIFPLSNYTYLALQQKLNFWISCLLLKICLSQCIFYLMTHLNHIFSYTLLLIHKFLNTMLWLAGKSTSIQHWRISHHVWHLKKDLIFLNVRDIFMYLQKVYLLKNKLFPMTYLFLSMIWAIFYKSEYKLSFF